MLIFGTVAFVCNYRGANTAGGILAHSSYPHRSSLDQSGFWGIAEKHRV